MVAFSVSFSSGKPTSFAFTMPRPIWPVISILFRECMAMFAICSPVMRLRISPARGINTWWNWLKVFWIHTEFVHAEMVKDIMLWANIAFKNFVGDALCREIPKSQPKLSVAKPTFSCFPNPAISSTPKRTIFINLAPESLNCFSINLGDRYLLNQVHVMAAPTAIQLSPFYLKRGFQ